MNCPICNAIDGIYVEKNENTDPAEETRFCTVCGYQTSSKFKLDSENLIQCHTTKYTKIIAYYLKKN